MKQRNRIFLAILIAALVVIGLIAKPDISTIFNGVLTSIIASLLFFVFTILVDNSSDETKKGIQEINEKVSKINEYIDISAKNLREKLGIIKIENRKEYSYAFWSGFLNDALTEKSKKFIISGKTLHRWLESEIVNDFKKSLLEMINEKVKIDFVIYKNPKESRKKDALREFLSNEIFPHLVEACGRNLIEINKILNIYEVDSLPYLYTAIDSQVVVAQYFNNTSNSENIMLVLSPDCPFAHKYQEDFKAIQKSRNNKWIKSYLEQTKGS